MWIGVVSLFPEMFSALTEFGVSARALKEQKFDISFWNPRDYSADKHQRVDDRPFGGGPGMVMQVEPLLGALNAARELAASKGLAPKVIYLSPQGQVLRQEAVNGFADCDSLILISGRYEGIDERFLENEVDEEWSIGDYVLSGGELPAMVLLDALIRQIPGVLGHDESAAFDSFANENQGLLDCPHYTRPEEVMGKSVPQVLLSGHHEQIRRWRLKQSVLRTLERRPELLKRLVEQSSLNGETRTILEELGQHDVRVQEKLKS